MDILLVGGLDFTKMDAAMPLIGQEILKSILDAEFETRLVNFDMLNRDGLFTYSPDISSTLDAMAEYLVAFNAKVIGFYTICNSFLTTLQLARRVRRLCPDTAIVFGGPHASVTAKACIEELPFVDAVSRGESEKSILPLMRALINGKELLNVPGVTFRRGGKAVSTPDCELLRDDELSLYTVYFHGQDWHYQGGIALEGGRGCPFSCTFCSTRLFWGQRFRVKPVKTLIAEMDKFNSLYGAVGFSIQHDIFTANREHISEFCRVLIERKRPYSWRCSSRIDVLDAELIELMARAGCVQIYLGIESGSERMQKILKKNLDLTFAKKRINELCRAGIYATSSFIYGFLEETEEDFLKTLAVMEQFYLSGNKSVQLHRFFPLPATDEALKVKDMVYFDENDVDLSIFNRKTISDEGRELIIGHKELFLQFYAFEACNRKKYPWIETVPLFLSTISEGFYETGKCLVRLFGIRGLYQKYEQLFHELCLSFSDTAFTGNFSEIYFEYLTNIVKQEGSKELNELFRYERALLSYAMAKKNEAEVNTFALDIMRAIKTGEYIYKTTSVMFWRELGTGALHSSVVPEQICIRE